MIKKRTFESAIAAFALLFMAAWAGGQTYSYDPLGRLIEARYDGTHTIQYQNDRLGNITNLVIPVTQAETDGDADSMADAWEYVWFNLLTNTAAGDYNQDTINNLTHYQQNTDPTNPDTDGDGMNNRDEQQAGTSPTNAASVLRVEHFDPRAAPGPVIQWQSVADKHYALERITNLLSGSTAEVRTNILATPTMNVYTDAAAGASSFSTYRIRLE